MQILRNKNGKNRGQRQKEQIAKSDRQADRLRKERISASDATRRGQRGRKSLLATEGGELGSKSLLGGS